VTTSPPTQSGTGHNLVPELAVQEALVRGLHLLVQDEAAIDELLNRLDVLQQGSQSEWVADQRAALLEMLDPSTERYVKVLIGHPATVAELPCLGISDQGGGENTSEAVAGDELHRFYTLIRESDLDPPLAPTVADPDLRLDTEVKPTDSMCVRHQVMGTGEQSTIEVSCWAVAPERALLLQAAARWAIFHNKGLLTERGIHDVTWRTSAFAPATEMEPRIGYVPTLTLTLNWTFRETRRKIVPNRVTIGSGRFTA
jgi:hypothetical protein